MRIRTQFTIIGIAALFFCLFPSNSAAQSTNSLSKFSSLATEADLHTGSVNFSLPIEVPQGRGGIQPNLQLQYSSNLPNGMFGVGWALEIGAIQRMTKQGAPKYDGTDKFILKQSGSVQELVSVGADIYRPKIEGAFAIIEFVNNEYWVVTDKQGIKYTFGQNQAAQEFDPGNNDRIFKWCLEKIVDLHGNYMTFTYQRDSQKLYPLSIDYTGNEVAVPNLPTHARVEFVNETRPDKNVPNYIAGYKSELNLRINEIKVYADNNLQRRYDISYSPSPTTGRTIITSIVQYAPDDSSLPEIQYEYYQNSGLYFNRGDAVHTGLLTLVGDFNGDGLMDKASYKPFERKLYVTISEGSTFGSEELWLTISHANNRFFSGDFNGDGRTDVVYFHTIDNSWHVALSNGTVFVDSGTWLGNYSNSSEKQGTADFNNDGLTDIVRYFEDTQTPGWSRAQVALNKGISFEVMAGSILLGSPSDTPMAVDFNGDGLVDLASFDQCCSGRWYIRLNKGDLTTDFEELPAVYFGLQRSPVIADFNSDGLVDLGYYEYEERRVKYIPFDGQNFGTEETIPFIFKPGMQYANVSVRAADFNGDGLTDLLATDQDSKSEMAFSIGIYPDLMKRLYNGIGAKTEITYDSSVNYPNDLLPFPLRIVKAIRRSNDLGSSYLTTYSYADGLWSTQEREFRGFGTVKVIDAELNYSETDFLQDDIYKGRPSEQRTYDSSDNLYGKTVNTWTSTQEVEPWVKFVYLERKDNFVYDGDATGRRTAEEFFYEEPIQRGNLTKAVQLGEVDLTSGNYIGSDKRTVETTYVTNSTTNVSLPNVTIVKDDSGVQVRKTTFYYDYHDNENDQPDKGLLTKKIDWAGDDPGDIDPVTTYFYDDYGNLEKTIDPNQNQLATGIGTTITYDTDYQIFPLITENALGHQVTNEYYGVNEAVEPGFTGLWGQLKGTTDPNNQVGRRTYDAFGRLAASVSPNDSVSLPTQIVEYHFSDPMSLILKRSRVKSGQAATIDSYGYFDGFGRQINIRKRSATPGQYIVQGQTEYDSRGLPIRKYMPFFSTDPFPPIDQSRTYTTIEYDAMGRAIKTINPDPDNTYATVEYDDWTTRTIDENGHQQESDFDAYGRLVEKREYLGADGRSPHYSFVAYTLYATTKYEYDSEGNLTKAVSDAGAGKRNITIDINYDELGRKTSMNDPDMGFWQYEYDLNGNLKKQTDAKGQVINFDYDNLNRLKKKYDGVNLDVDYTYDDPAASFSKGRLTAADYSSGGTTFNYDELGREVHSVKTINVADHDVNRQYDALNRLLDVQYPDEEHVYYQYDAAGRVNSVSNDQSLLPPDPVGGDDPLLPDPGGMPVYVDPPFAHYKLNDNADEWVVADSGLGANDARPSTYTSSLSTAGKIELAFLLNVSQQEFVNCENLRPHIISNNTGTVTMWIKKGEGNATPPLFSLGDYRQFRTSNFTIYSIETGNQLQVHLNDHDTGTQFTVRSPPDSLNSDQEWTHIAVVQDGVSVKLYVNGVEGTIVGELTTNPGAWLDDIQDDLNKCRIGSYYMAAGVDFFEGTIDDFRYYDFALNAGEIAAIYNDGDGTEESEPLVP